MKKMFEQLNKKEQEETLQRLFTAASTIKNKNQTEQFLKEILTHSEQLMLGRRIWIAQLLLAGYTQQEIGQKLQAGPNTIRRVGKWLDEKLPGYADAIKRKDKRFKTKNNAEYVDPFSFKALRRKYPMHFLLFNIAEALISKK